MLQQQCAWSLHTLLPKTLQQKKANSSKVQLSALKQKMGPEGSHLARAEGRPAHSKAGSRTDMEQGTSLWDLENMEVLLWDREVWESSQWDLENMALGALATRGPMT